MLHDPAIGHLIDTQYHKLHLLASGGDAKKFGAMRPTRRPEFATDGKRLYFTLTQSESDVWVIEVGRP